MKIVKPRKNSIEHTKKKKLNRKNKESNNTVSLKYLNHVRILGNNRLFDFNADFRRGCVFPSFN
jgi:hypothetical protein